MMNRSDSQPSLFRHYSGARLPLFWLIVACLAGILYSAVYAYGFISGDQLIWPTGRLFFAFYGALVYGWGIPVLFSDKPEKTCQWWQAVTLCWHACVAIGVISIMGGDGSGVLMMPFSRWLFPIFAILVSVMACSVWFRSECWHVRLVFSSYLGCLAVSLWVLWYTQALSMNGVLDAYSLVACLTCGMLFSALAMVAVRLHISHGRIFRILSVWMSLVLLSAPVIGGLGNLYGFPVPWLLVEAGGIWVWCVALPAVLLSVFCWLHVAFRTHLLHLLGISLLSVLAVWNAYSIIEPELMPFSLAAWYEAELWILTGGMVILLSGIRQTQRPSIGWSLLCFGIGGIVIAYALGIFAVVDVQAFPEAKRPELMCGWVGVTSCVHAVAMALCCGGSCCLWWGIGSSSDLQCCKSQRRQYILPIVASLAIWSGVMVVAVFFHSPESDCWEVRRPAQDAQGAEIYASEGCALCHTQLIRRTLSGREWQTAINRGTDPDFSYRVSEPEDMDAEYNREGAPHVGLATVGPDLSNATEYIVGRLEYEDAVSGSIRRAAQVKEWLALHLYHPQETQFGHPWTLCPAMPGFFEERQIKGCSASSYALPVKMEQGKELVPSERGQHLLNYLMSLRRVEPSIKRGRQQDVISRSHIHPHYVANPPIVDMEHLKKAQATAVMEKGRGVFLSKCSICHGNDGMGDQVNYPPLNGSEWLKEKTDAEILNIILQGLSGPISVKGKKWDSSMLPPGVTDSRDLANLLTFLRRRFGGVEKEAYSPEQIDTIRKEL